jgi:hypothetical protein
MELSASPTFMDAFCVEKRLFELFLFGKFKKAIAFRIVRKPYPRRPSCKV